MSVIIIISVTLKISDSCQEVFESFSVRNRSCITCFPKFNEKFTETRYAKCVQMLIQTELCSKAQPSHIAQISLGALEVSVWASFQICQTYVKPIKLNYQSIQLFEITGAILQFYSFQNIMQNNQVVKVPYNVISNNLLLFPIPFPNTLDLSQTNLPPLSSHPTPATSAIDWIDLLFIRSTTIISFILLSLPRITPPFRVFEVSLTVSLSNYEVRLGCHQSSGSTTPHSFRCFSQALANKATGLQQCFETAQIVAMMSNQESCFLLFKMQTNLIHSTTIPLFQVHVNVDYTLLCFFLLTTISCTQFTIARSTIGRPGNPNSQYFSTSSHTNVLYLTQCSGYIFNRPRNHRSCMDKEVSN